MILVLVLVMILVLVGRRTRERRRQENKLVSERNTEFHRGEEVEVSSDCEVKVSLRNEPKTEPHGNIFLSTAG
jgi:membrane protein implicated in regulation of membrane protease activity